MTHKAPQAFSPSNWPLSVKLVIIFSVISLLPLLFLGWYGFRTARSALMEENNNALETSANELAFHLDLLLNERLANIAVLAQYDVVRDFVAAWPDVPPELSTDAQKVINDLNSSHDFFHSVYLMSPEGDVTISTADNVGDNFGFRPYFQAAMNGEAYISDISISVDAGIPVMYFSAPIYDYNGVVRGVALLRVRAGEIWTLVDQKNGDRQPGSSTLLVDQYGMRIADATEPELVFKTIVPLDPQLEETLLAQRRLGTMEDIESTNYPELAQGIEESAQFPLFTYRLSEQSDLYHASSAHLESKPWVVIETIPESIFLAPVRHIQEITGYSALVVSIFLLSSVIYTSWRITRPVKALTLSADTIANGDLNHSLDHLDYNQQDEIGTLIKSVKAMQSSLKKSYSDLDESYTATIEALSSALDYRDCETEGHSLRVTQKSIEIAEALGLSFDQIQTLTLGALLHDVGKIGISDTILHKEGPLNEREWEIMKRHPLIGYKIVKGIKFLERSSEVILYHHEKFDGSGYPHSLAGEDIPLLARIFSVSDAYDAIISDRPYRAGRSHEEAIAEIKRCSGSHFDPEIVKVFMRIATEEKPPKKASISNIFR